MTIALIALGSNLGKRQTALRAAIARLSQIQDTSVQAVATFRETRPVDSPPGAPNFINSAAQLDTDLTAQQLLDELLRIERELGRTRDPAAKNTPRLIDLDLILFGDHIISAEHLTIPHPRMHERRFVLEPLAQIAPAALHPVMNRTIRELLDALSKDDHSPLEAHPCR